MLDYVIRGGTLVDGTGDATSRGDIGIKDGLIAELGGTITTAAKEVIDASGAVVTPGYIDVHTHYDGQVTWDDAVEPSASHGVTTVVMGNCGVGFAPVRPGKEQGLIELMEGVEDIPGTALYDGMPWGEWETFPEYLDFLAGRKYALDIGAQIPHGAIRTYVMGERGVHNEASTADDIAAMSQLVEDGMKAGALGFSTSRIIGHQSLTGESVPGTFASEDELMGLAMGMKRAGFGVLESIPSDAVGELPHHGPDHSTTEAEVDLMAKVSRETGRPITFSLFQLASTPDKWRSAMNQAVEANASGAQLFPQVSSRPPGVLISFSAYHPFLRRETYVKLRHLPLDKRIIELRKPEVKAAILADSDLPDEEGTAMKGLHKFLQANARSFYVLGDPLDYEPDTSKSIGSIADAKGLPPEAVLYDYLLEQDGRAYLMLIQTNYIEGNHNILREMILQPETIVGLGDGGAHVRLICDGSMQTFALSHWVRDRYRGEKIPIETIVQKMTSQNADLYGMADRGRLKVGLRADINVIDIDKLYLHAPQSVHDLPGGSPRFIQPADGYVATFVHGGMTRKHSKDTGARTGRLVRGKKLH